MFITQENKVKKKNEVSSCSSGQRTKDFINKNLSKDDDEDN